MCVLFLCLQYSLENPDEDALEFGVLSQSDLVTKTFTIYNINPVQVRLGEQCTILCVKNNYSLWQQSHSS